VIQHVILLLLLQPLMQLVSPGHVITVASYHLVVVGIQLTL
jgi:hypothetical protein